MAASPQAAGPPAAWSTGAPHAGPNDMPRQAGDMGNVTAGEDGVATLDYVDDQIAFEGPSAGPGSVVVSGSDLQVLSVFELTDQAPASELLADGHYQLVVSRLQGQVEGSLVQRD